MTQNDINNTASIMAIDNITIDGNTISSTDANGNVVLAPNGAGTVSVTTAPIVPSGDRADSLGSATNSWDNVYADGVSFDDGTNVLSSYVGPTSFTPVLAFGGASVGITYTTQEGYYVRVGSIVHGVVNILLSSKGTSVGGATITGFPFTSSAALTVQTFTCGQWSGVNLNASQTVLGMYFNGTTSTITFTQYGDNSAFQGVLDSAFTNGSSFYLPFSVMI